MNPRENPEAYDRIAFAGDTVDLLCEVTDAELVREWEVAKANGSSGATVKFTGDGASKPKLKLYAWLPEHFAEWERVKPTLEREPGKTSQAFDVSHPSLEECGIRSVTLGPFKAWAQTSPGMWVKEIQLTQYRAPKPASAKPTSSKGGPDDPPGGAAKDKYDAQIDDLSKQLDEMGKGG